MLGLLLIRGALWRHSEEVLPVPVILRPQAEESYSTELLLVECFLSETGVLRSFAPLRMTREKRSG